MKTKHARAKHAKASQIQAEEKEEAPGVNAAGGTPTKSFFIDMITKDIRLEDCILDLIDNSIDAATRTAPQSAVKRYKGDRVHIKFDQRSFSIEDNCGGMTREMARKYAFHFGRPARADSLEIDHGIGLYGIGMKRAFLKMGLRILVRSSTTTEGLEVPIDVDVWRENDTEDWDFELKEIEPEEPGTLIQIENLHDGISDELARVNFPAELRQRVALTYGAFLERGFVVKVNGEAVKAIPLTLRSGREVKPARLKYKDAGLPSVTVEIIAGMRSFPRESEGEAGGAEERTSAMLNGWFVACNDRIVVAADRTTRTGWGTGRGSTKIGVWHPQYNGFFGIVRLSSANPRDLPWATTKRELDYEAPVWRRALDAMRPITRALTSYSNKRKSRVEIATPLEKGKAVKLDAVARREAPLLPDLSKKAGRGKAASAEVRVSYMVRRGRADRLIRRLDPTPSDYDEMGEAAFEYVYRLLVNE